MIYKIKKYLQYKRIVNKLNKNSYLAFMLWDMDLNRHFLKRRLKVESLWNT